MFSKLPWHHEDHPQKGEGESLTTVLPDTSSRTELTLLIATATETMRQGILDTFDPNQKGHQTVPDSTSTQEKKATGNWSDSVRSDIAAQDKAQKEQTAREKEISSPKMQETKASALKHFDEWREQVISRVGEVVNAKEAARQQEKDAHAHQSQTTSRRSLHADKDYIDSDRALREAFAPINTPLVGLDEPKRALILHSLLLLMLSLEKYTAYSRVLLLYVTTSLHLSIKFLAEDESKVARGLLEAADMKADEEQKKAAEANADSRKWKVGMAAVGGAALLAVTGGLAAPLLAAGVGSVMGSLGLASTAAAGYLGTVAGSTVVVGGLFGAYGAKMSSKMMDSYARECSDFAFLAVRHHHRPRKIEKEYRRLRVAIGISGWLTSKNDVVEPWKVVGEGLESFALRFELEALLALGNAITTMITSTAIGYAKKEIIRRTLFASLTAGLWPLGLLKISRIIDNPFSVAKTRADKAGELLADAIINKAQGERPVTLVGYSLGSRVIYVCLRKLAERKAFGLVESVVLIGSPCPSDSVEWRLIRSAVSGRVVNVYSTADWLLAFLYRSSSVQFGVAGLQAIEGVPGIQNVDVTSMVEGHTSYRYLVGTILQKIGFEDLDHAQLKKQEEERAEQVAKEEKERQKNEASEPQQQGQAKQEESQTLIDTKETPSAPSSAPAGVAGDSKEGVPTDLEVEKLEAQVELKNKQSMMDWMTEKLQLGGATATTAAVKAKTWYMTRGTPAAAALKTANAAHGQVDGATGAVGGPSTNQVVADAGKGVGTAQGATGGAQGAAGGVKDVAASAPQPSAEADLGKTEALGAEERAADMPQLP